MEQCAVFGVKTNAPLLHTIMTHSAFQKGDTHTSFLDEYGLIGSNVQLPDLPDAVLLAAVLYEVQGNNGSEAIAINASQMTTITTNPWKTLGPWRMIGEARQVTYTYQDKTYTVAISPVRDGRKDWQIQVDTQAAEQVQCTIEHDGTVLLRRGTNQVRAYVQHSDGEIQVALQGYMYRLRQRQPPDVDTTAHGGSTVSTQKALTAPMAGTIIKVQAHEGDTVEQRQVLVILSAMKMEHTVVAPYEGKVRRIFFQEGDVVKGGATIVEME